MPTYEDIPAMPQLKRHPRIDMDAPKESTARQRHGSLRMMSVSEVFLDKIAFSPKNNFRPLEGEEFEELKNSIRMNGVITPVILREAEKIKGYTVDKPYECLSGHNRIRAVQELGGNYIPAEVVICDDAEAMKIMLDTNIQRGEVSELEKAWAYRNLFEALNRNGRNQYSDDLEAEGENVESEDSATVAESSSKKETVAVIGEMYGIAPRTVRSKIRLTYLIDALYRKYEKRIISQKAAVELSYLDENIQRALLALQKQYGFELTDENCHRLRVDYNEWRRNGEQLGEQAYTDNRIMRMIRGESESGDVEKEEKSAKPKRYVVDDTLFPARIKKADRADYVARALRYILEHEIEL